MTTPDPRPLTEIQAARVVLRELADEVRFCAHADPEEWHAARVMWTAQRKYIRELEKEE